MTKRILVIEDNQKHIDDAKAFFADKPEYQVEYAENGEKAFRLLNNPSNIYDGVITDIFMPWGEHYPSEQPAGFGIAILCCDMGIPCVMNTAGHHHGQKYQWIHCLSTSGSLRPKLGGMIDGGLQDMGTEADTKRWNFVEMSLKEKMNQPKS